MHLADLGRPTAIAYEFGFDRGPVDRYYIERFLTAHAEDIRGEVPELGYDRYTRRRNFSRVLGVGLHCAAFTERPSMEHRTGSC